MWTRFHPATAWPVVLAGCAADARPVPGVTVEQLELRSDAAGVVEVPFAVEDPRQRVQVIVEGPGTLATERLTGPRRDEVLDWEVWTAADEWLTEAIFPTTWATTLNWPVREEDAPLAEGDWLLEAATLDEVGAYVGEVDVDVTILRALRRDLGSGTLPVLVAYARGLAEDPEVVAGVEAGVGVWAQLYEAYGLELRVEWTTLDVAATLPDAHEGLPEVEALLEGRTERTVLLLVGDTLAGSPTWYGQAGGIPGPFHPTPAAVVEVSWLAHAGADGRFSADETRLFGETMAHETGHYLGLFHPVEDGFAWFDALDDTPRCAEESECEAVLADNLMFPWPVCATAETSSCVAQELLTEAQLGVARRWVGVDG